MYTIAELQESVKSDLARDPLCDRTGKGISTQYVTNSIYRQQCNTVDISERVCTWSKSLLIASILNIPGLDLITASTRVDAAQSSGFS